jgi:Ras-related GTP-binding protein C/D
MSPHETLFRLEATQGCERALIDHTPLCRFTIWDFPGEYYGGAGHGNSNDIHNDEYGNGGDEQFDDTDDSIFTGSTSLIFVVDAQDEPYDHALQSIKSMVNCS